MVKGSKRGDLHLQLAPSPQPTPVGRGRKSLQKAQKQVFRLMQEQSPQQIRTIGAVSPAKQTPQKLKAPNIIIEIIFFT